MNLHRFRGLDESGIATVTAVAIIALLLTLSAALVQVGMVVAAKHRVQTAADLAALAGSASSLRGRDACATARTVARRNGAALRQCRTDLAVVTVRAVHRVRLAWRLRFRVEADARAAPTYYVRGAPRSTRSSRRTAPALSSGSLPLPHFGDWMHDGHPVAQTHWSISSRVTRSQVSAIS